MFNIIYDIDMPQKNEMHLFHTTSYHNLKQILKTKNLAISPEGKNDMMLETSSGFIFTNLVFNDIVNYVTQDKLHWIGECVIELDIDLLRKYKFVICHIGAFENVQGKSAKELKEMKDVYAYGRGNLKRMPSLRNVKEQIIKNMSGQQYLGKYMHSHEVLFMKDIPVSLCKRIIVYNEQLYKNIKSCLKRYKIDSVALSLFPQEAMFNTRLFINKLNEK